MIGKLLFLTCLALVHATPEYTGPFLPNGCPAEPHVHWLLPHEECSKFYYCVWFEKAERVCPAGLHFNPVLQVCDWPWRAGCESDASEVVDPSKCAEGCDVLPWAHDIDCDKFWRCEGETPTLVTCAEGLQFNSETGTCDYSCNVNCVRSRIQRTIRHDGVSVWIPTDEL